MSQPNKEEKAYYMNESFAIGCMCFEIPSQRKAAVKPGYPNIIVDGVVILDKDTMMYTVTVRERTEWQWQAVMDSTGLVIEQIWTKTQEEDSIMILMPKLAEY